MIQNMKSKCIGWTAVAMIVIATIIRALDYSNILDLTFTLLGCILWTWDGVLTKNKPLVAVNVFSVIVISLGIIRYFY